MIHKNWTFFVASFGLDLSWQKGRDVRQIQTLFGLTKWVYSTVWLLTMGVCIFCYTPASEEPFAEGTSCRPCGSSEDEREGTYFWWPGIHAEIEEEAKDCSDCQNVRHMPQTTPLHPCDFPEKPWQRIHFDQDQWRATCFWWLLTFMVGKGCRLLSLQWDNSCLLYVLAWRKCPAIGLAPLRASSLPRGIPFWRFKGWESWGWV